MTQAWGPWEKGRRSATRAIQEHHPRRAAADCEESAENAQEKPRTLLAIAVVSGISAFVPHYSPDTTTRPVGRRSICRVLSRGKRARGVGFGRLASTAAYVRGRSGTSSRMGAQDRAGRPFRFTACAADRFLRVILSLRGGDLFKGKSNLASSARKQRSSPY